MEKEEESSSVDGSIQEEKEEEKSNDSTSEEEEEEEEEEPKHKRPESLYQDRISAFPDSILHYILSLLPIEDAIKTGVLSNRWKDLWTSLPNLVFSYKPDEGNECEIFRRDCPKFFHFIDKTLILYSSEKIKKFSLSFEYLWADYGVDSRILLWLRFATIRKVEDLHLGFSFDQDHDSPYQFGSIGYELPQLFYNNSSLTKFCSRLCQYEPKANVCWPSLKALTINETEFSEGVLQKVLLGCPLLEYLELQRCRRVCKIDTSSNTRLKKLVLYDAMEDDDQEISVPTVNSLEISGSKHGYTSLIKLLDISSLIDITLDFWVNFELEHFGMDIDDYQGFCQLLAKYVDMLQQLLEKVNRVKQVKLGNLFVQVLSLLELRALPSPLSNHNRKCIQIATKFHSRDLYGLASLLNSSPYLEKLVIKWDIYPKWGYYLHELDGVEGKDFWATKERSFECLLKHLKIVEIVGLEPLEEYFKHDELFEFVEFLLRNAMVLEKVIIVPKQLPGSKIEDFYDVTQRLVGLPRSSPHAVVLLPE